MSFTNLCQLVLAASALGTMVLKAVEVIRK